MKRLITIFLLAFVGIGIYATNVQSYEEIEGGVKIKFFSTDDTKTLTIANKYKSVKESGNDYEPDEGGLSVIEIGTGGVMMKNGVAEQYEEIVIESKKLTTINAKAFSNLINVTTFKILTTTPPSITETSSPTVWLTACALTVPEEALEAYKDSEWINYFYSINGEVINHSTTAVTNITANDINIKVQGNVILLNSANNVTVYSITGQQVFTGTTDAVTISNSGIYIVKTPQTTQKVVIK